MDYAPRIVDAELTAMLAGLPAIAIDGPKAVGKTATASRRAASVIELDDPDQLILLQADRERLARLPKPVLLDEWQLYPTVWDTVRRNVDHDSRPGQYLLAGSATPTKAPTHSGAGRIVHLRMRPMAFSERGITPPTVSLGQLLSGSSPIVTGESAVTLVDYASEITRSGFPAIRLQPESYRSETLDGYLAAIVEHDFPDAGYTVRRPASLRAWLAAYAAASSTTASYDSIIRAATPGDSAKPSRSTAQDYREVLAKLWVLDQVPGWLPSRNRLSGLGQAPKHQLADPALAARLLRVSADALISQADIGPPELRDGPLLGALFESLVTLSVRAYAQASGASVHHLRTHRGDHEVDLIVERPDGRVLALEVKLSGTVDDKDTRHLRWLAKEIGPDLVDSAVITTGKVAYRRPDGIAVIPLALLGP
ncbi:ATP-binding protein [Cryobacterium frigoriphilum]|uniref:ATP-binding protein n=1 Tax=Cryobacterium frigoriphilum TaxID=1259150 RepID=A0A4V3IQP6_9MICO|nr:DUF4143 domain-containing protein [Cryobacterium frigoriphilum]TFD47856.1 ATP-binding protein [Cryobacterium frigoriphilum]